MQNLVQNLLDMSRIDANKVQLKKEPVIVSDLLSVTLKKLEEQRKDKAVSLNIGEELPVIFVDFVLMEQAIRNIVSNAFPIPRKMPSLKFPPKSPGGNF